MRGVQKICGCADELGFYHGMKVNGGGKEYIMCGPAVLFVAAEIPAGLLASTQPGEQLSLF